MMSESFTEDDVARLISVGDAIDLVQEAFEAAARGDVAAAPRSTTQIGHDLGFFRVMPAVLANRGLAGVKVGVVQPGRRKTAVHYFLYDVERGALIAVLEADHLGQLRTAAASAVATRTLARRGVRSLGLLGTGKHARAHLDALVYEIRDLSSIKVFAPNQSRLLQFVADARERHPTVEITSAVDAEDAVTEADIIVTATRSETPVLRFEWVCAGAHLNVIGSNRADHREIDSSTMARSRVFVDDIEQSRRESGDLIMAVAEGAMHWSDVRGELGDVLLGRIAGRESSGEITLFKSNGLAVQDLFIADAVLRAFRREAGSVVQ